jgi:large subunit GTPase 1
MEESSDDRQLTPFEKNLEVWKQLWRVLERSHIVVQILDARNPLLFRSRDLERYVAELDAQKTCLLVINKADYLTPAARRYWADYFTSKGIDFVFWSAALEQQRLDDLDRARRRREQRHNYHGHNIERVDEGKIKGASSDEEEEEDEEDDELAGGRIIEDDEDMNDEQDDKSNTLKASSLWKEDAQHAAVEKLSLSDPSVAAVATASAAAPSAAAPSASASAAAGPASAASASTAASSSAATPAPAHPSPPIVHAILTRDALFSYIIAKYVSHSAENKARYESGEKIIAGMTGFPNVGKSSTINVLAGAKKVTTGATPGKTKHFQTINVNEQITLCDWSVKTAPSDWGTLLCLLLTSTLFSSPSALQSWSRISHIPFKSRGAGL